jgi:hypothetical protein
VVAAPAGLDVPISGLAIVDPDDEPDEHSGGLVLIVGARGRSAVPLVRAAGAAGAAAVAVKDADACRATIEAGVALLAVPPDVRWERLESLAAGVLDAASAPTTFRPRPDRRTAHARHRLHRGHGQPGARLLPFGRRRRPGRRAAQALHPGLAGSRSASRPTSLPVAPAGPA